MFRFRAKVPTLRRRGEVDLGEQALVIIPRTVHPFGVRPHLHQLGWKRDQQIMRVRLAAEPPLIVSGAQDCRIAGMRSWIRVISSFDGTVMILKVCARRRDSRPRRGGIVRSHVAE